MPVTPVLRGRDGWVLGAFWPASLAKMASVRFSKRSCLMGIRQRMIEEDNILSGLHICRHRNVHIHTCTLHKRKEKEKEKILESF